MVPDDKKDGLVCLRSVARVDLGGKLSRLVLEVPIGRKPAACRCGVLKEGEAATPLRMAAEKSVHGTHAVEDALGIVEPLDADAQSHLLVQTEAGTHGDTAFRNRLLFGKCRRRPFDRDRIRAYLR